MKNHLAGFIEKEEIMKNKTNTDETLFIDGFPVFNDCDHHTIDMTHVKNGTEHWMNTVTIKLPNGKSATMCVMDLGTEINVDAKFYGFEESKVIGFKNGRSESIKDKDLFALIAKKK